MKKNKILFLVLVVALFTLTIGCTTTKPQMRARTQTRIGMDGTNNQAARKRNNNMLGTDRRNMDNLSGLGSDTTDNLRKRDNVIEPNNISNRADTIAQRVANLNEVNNCSVLLSGNTCIVGVDMKNNLQGKMTTALKRKVERTVKNTDNSIKNVSVTADPDIFTRINNMATDIGNGKPMSGFATQFQEILRRITPAK